MDIGKRPSYLAAAFLLALLCCASTAFGAEVKEFSFETRDSLYMHAWLTASPDKAPVPLVITLHMRATDHAIFEPFIAALVKACRERRVPQPVIVNADLRGHGKSVNVGHFSTSFETMDTTKFKQIPEDVADLIAYCKKTYADKIDTNDIRLVGASIGANAAMISTTEATGVTRVAMLSPGEDYSKMKPMKAMEAFQGRKLGWASKDDLIAEASMRYFVKHDSALVSQMFDGSHHGTNIINNDPKAMQALIDWLLEK